MLKYVKSLALVCAAVVSFGVTAAENAPSAQADAQTVAPAVELSDRDMAAEVAGAPTGYISYGAVSAGRIPCSRTNTSAKNCRPGPPANEYTRGCSAATRCRGG